MAGSPVVSKRLVAYALFYDGRGDQKDTSSRVGPDLLLFAALGLHHRLSCACDMRSSAWMVIKRPPQSWHRRK